MSGILERAETKQNNTAELASLLRRITEELQAAVDMTIAVRRQSPQDKPVTIALWEEFLCGLFGYIKQKSKESKDNLLSGISLTRIKFF